MKCWSRSTLGLIIGAINVLSYGGATIMIVINLVQINTLLRPNENSKIDQEQLETALTVGKTILAFLLVFCVAMAIVSALLIVGIIKRRHSLMAPWLVISAISFVCSTVGFFYRIIALLLSDVPVIYVIFAFIFGCLLIGLEFLILYKIYALYKDIRAKYHEKPLQMVVGGQMPVHSNNHGIQENGYNGFHVVTEKY